MRQTAQFLDSATKGSPPPIGLSKCRKHRPRRRFRHFERRFMVKTHRKSLTHARNTGCTDAKGTSSAGCAVKTSTNGMSVFARLQNVLQKTIYRHVGLRAFMSTSEPTPAPPLSRTRRRTKHRPHQWERHFECRMCCKNQNKRHVPLSPSRCTKYRLHRCERHFECRMCCTSQYKRHAPPPHPSRMHETSATPMGKALRVQDVL